MKSVLLQQLINQQAALVAAAAQGSTFISPVAALSSPPHVTVGSLTAMANGGLPQPAAAAGNGITTTAAGLSTDPSASVHSANSILFFTEAVILLGAKKQDETHTLFSIKLRHATSVYRFTYSLLKLTF